MVILNPLKEFQDEIHRLLANAIDKMLVQEPGQVHISLETPPPGKGDFAFPCFSLAAQCKKAPNLIAQEIMDYIDDSDLVSKVNIGPYINFYMNPDKLSEATVHSILELESDYGCSGQRDIKIILEHTSANPTDNLHIGRARNPIIGDTLARVLRKAGYSVETQYYVDDMGKQAARKTLGQRYADSDIIDLERHLGDYQWATSVTTAESPDYDQKYDDELNEIMRGMEDGNPEIISEVKNVCKIVMTDKIVSALAKLNVHVDTYVYESKFMLDGCVKKVVDTLKKSPYTKVEDGAFFVDLEQLNIGYGSRKFFFVRSDGTSLYATRDIAYHRWKFDRSDIVLNILGEDHKLEAEYVNVGLKLCGLSKVPEVIFYSFVALPEGRMSTRAGKVVIIDDLMGEAIERAYLEIKKRRTDTPEDEMWRIAETIGIGAIRYNIIKVQPEKKIVFRWEDALNFEGDSAPFIQYAHARACSILRKSKGYGDYAEDYDTSLLTTEHETNLIRKLAEFPSVVEECANERKAHTLTSYAHEVASLFNQFYRDCPVLHVESELRSARLALVDSTKWVLRNVLDLIGIDAPEYM